MVVELLHDFDSCVPAKLSRRCPDGDMTGGPARSSDVDPPPRAKRHARDPRVSPSPLSLCLSALEEVADAEPDDLRPAEPFGAFERLRSEVGLGRWVREDESVHGQTVSGNGNHRLPR